MSDYTTRNFTTNVVERVCERLGFAFIQDGGNVNSYQIVFPNGVKTSGRSTILDINGAASAKVARNKMATHAWLLHYNHATIPTQLFTAQDDRQTVRSAVEKIGMPCVIKPNEGTRTRGITILENINELDTAIHETESVGTEFLVQPFITGRHYRFTVFQGKVVLIYEKPAFWASEDIIDDAVEAHPSYRETIARSVSDLGLAWSGVDVIVRDGHDIKQPATAESYVIVEINSAPTLKRYAERSEKNLAFIEGLYSDIMNAISTSHGN